MDCLLFHLVVQQVSVCISLCNVMVTSSFFCLCVALVYINVCDAGLFVRGGRQQVEGRGVHVEIKQKGQNVIFDLFPCTISLSLYIFSRGVIWTAPWSPTYTTTITTAPLHRRGYGCPFHSPLSACPPPPPPALPVVPWPVTLAGGGPKSSGVPAGRGRYVWGTTRRVTWSVGVATSCKRDVHTATTTTTPLLLYRNLSPYQ